MSAPEPLLCWLWLAHTLGPASPHAGRVVDAFVSAQAAWEARGSESFRRVAGNAAAQRAQRPENTPDAYAELVMRCDALDVHILTYEDPDYPLEFSRIPDLPPVLYYTGNPAWLNARAKVGMVGSRKPTEYGLRAAEEFGTALARADAVIVSGMAEGLDSKGHDAASKEGKPSIAVLGVPIDRSYPASSRILRDNIERRGCVISEYPPDFHLLPRVGFLQRNRLIAALSAALLVVEAQEKSGTMSTVHYAERYGRPLFVIPGSIYWPNSAGTNRLLYDGRARAACRPADLLQELGLSPEAAVPPEEHAPEPLSENERKVLSCLGQQSRGMEELSARSGLSTAALSAVLMKLELSRRVTCLPGKRYILR